MIVLEKGIMLDGTKIQIEEWKESYSFMEYGSTLVAYPKSKQTLKGSFSPNLNDTFRCEFKLSSHEECEKAFNEILTGSKNLADFKELLRENEDVDCI